MKESGVCEREGRAKAWRLASSLVLAAAVVPLSPHATVVEGAPIAPHRALYSLSLGVVRNDSGLIDARGMMAYEWGESCDGWIIEQRYRLKLDYGEKEDEDLRSSFVTWESKDGLSYRFNQKETKNGKAEATVRGAAILEGPEKGGVALFSKPRAERMALAPGTLFPSGHTILLIDAARAGKTFLLRPVFDGASAEKAAQVSAVIATKLAAPAAAADARPAAEKSPLLDRRGWRVDLAFFPAGSQALTPDYELGMDLLDNGVSRHLLIDYGDYTIRGKLVTIEPLSKPKC
jgi:EipB-like